MSDRKYIVVGLFVLVGLVLLGAMVVWFKGVAGFLRGGYLVRGHLASAVGIRTGKRVQMDGIEVGDVRDVTTSQPQRHGVWIHMRINPDTRIPDDAVFVAQQTTVGDIVLDFRTPAKIQGTWQREGPAPNASGDFLVTCRFGEGIEVRADHAVRLNGSRIGTILSVTPHRNEEPCLIIRARMDEGVDLPDAARVFAKHTAADEPFLQFETAAEPVMYLATNGKAEVDGVVKAPSLLPEDLMTDFRAAMSYFRGVGPVLENLKEFTEPRTLADLERDKGLKTNLWTGLEQFGATARILEDQLGNPDSDFRHLLAEGRAAAEQLRKTLARAEKLIDGADKAIATVEETGKTFNDTGKKAADTFDKAQALMAKLSKDLEGARALVANANGLMADIRGGKGSLGKLVTDDELHRALVTLVENLNALSGNVERLVTMWRKEGVLAKDGK